MQVASINLNEDAKVEFEFRGTGLAVPEDELGLVKDSSADLTDGWPVAVPTVVPPGVASKS